MTHLLMQRPHLRNLPEAALLPSGYALRSFSGEADLEPLARVLFAAFDHHWDVKQVRIKLTEAPDVKAVYVVTWQGNPIATASSRYLPERFPGSGVVHWVGTHPDHERRGLASTLIARLLRDFIDRGYKDAVVETDDFRISALRSYLKFGFIPVYDVKGEDHRYRWAAVFQTMFGR